MPVVLSSFIISILFIVVLAEETKTPGKTIKKAIVTSLLIMIAYDTFVIYANVEKKARSNNPTTMEKIMDYLIYWLSIQLLVLYSPCPIT